APSLTSLTIHCGNAGSLVFGIMSVCALRHMKPSRLKASAGRGAPLTANRAMSVATVPDSANRVARRRRRHRGRVEPLGIAALKSRSPASGVGTSRTRFLRSIYVLLQEVDYPAADEVSRPMRPLRVCQRRRGGFAA